MNLDVLEFDSSSLYELGTCLNGLMGKIAALPYGEYDVDSPDSIPYIKMVELMINWQLTINKKIDLIRHGAGYCVRLQNYNEYIKQNSYL